MKTPTATSSSPQSTPGRHDEIASRAYQLWETAGRPEGASEQFWFQAEKELGSSRPRQRASHAAPESRRPVNASPA